MGPLAKPVAMPPTIDVVVLSRSSIKSFVTVCYLIGEEVFVGFWCPEYRGEFVFAGERHNQATTAEPRRLLPIVMGITDCRQTAYRYILNKGARKSLTLIAFSIDQRV